MSTTCLQLTVSSRKAKSYSTELKMKAFPKLCVVVVVFGALGFTFAESRRLPHFNQFRSKYPGQANYGGLFSDEALRLEVGGENMTSPNDTCPLRISTMLNLIPYHVITSIPEGVDEFQYYTKTFKDKKSSANMYFMLDRDSLAKHLERVYGVPLISNVPSDFSGRKGIMLMNITGSNHAPCSALLWNGYGFHQAFGFLAHTNLSRVYFWQTPDESCSINVKTDGGGGGGLCFPSSSTVELETGDKVAMKDVKISQRVKTMNEEGNIIYTPVITFLDKSKTHRGQYYTISTESGKHVTLKPAHLIFKIKPDVTSLRLFSAVAIHASKIRLGDLIYTQAFGITSADRVVGVALGDDYGAYAPVTSEGTLFVDGALVSCFADLEDHKLAHSLMGPLRGLYSLAPNTVGGQGHYIHSFLRAILRPIGVRVLGEDKFYQDPLQKLKQMPDDQQH